MMTDCWPFRLSEILAGNNNISFLDSQCLTNSSVVSALKFQTASHLVFLNSHCVNSHCGNELPSVQVHMILGCCRGLSLKVAHFTVFIECRSVVK